MNLSDNGRSSEYADIFAERGRLYHKAMAQSKQARDLEFAQLFARTPCSAAERIVDAPSGGAYLGDFIRRNYPNAITEVLSLDFTSGFGETPVLVDPYGTWPVQEQWADRAICLAASHHIENLGALLENFHRATHPGSLIHLADVAPGSGIADFLDTFVDRHTCTGHNGIYRDFNEFTWPDWMAIRSIEKRKCPWRFGSEGDMLQFCLNLFGLGESAKALIRDALGQFVGFRVTEDGVELNWELVYVEAVRT